MPTWVSCACGWRHDQALTRAQADALLQEHYRTPGHRVVDAVDARRLDQQRSFDLAPRWPVVIGGETVAWAVSEDWARAFVEEFDSPGRPPEIHETPCQASSGSTVEGS
jgi:hypothetical protein